MGFIAGQTQRIQEACELLSRAVSVNPNDAEAHNNRGNALKELNQPAAAAESYDRAIALNPDFAEAHFNLSVVLRDLRGPAAALESCDKAIALHPGNAEAHNNRGMILQELGSLAAALESYDKAVALDPAYAEAYVCRGVALQDLGRGDAALESYDRAIQLKPDDASAYFNRAMCRLQRGDFARGWKDFEWRWTGSKVAMRKRNFAQPLWLGVEPLGGKTILLHSEQGYGDTIQFCRYARLVSALGAKVVLEVPPPLLRLFKHMEGASEVLARGAALPAFDYHCPLLSLPLAFKTDQDTVPADVPYLRSDAGRVAAWRNRLGGKLKPRVGLVWSGRPEHKNDRNRSMALREMLSLVGNRAEWVSLQKDVREADAEVLASRADIRHFGGELKDFADTAALVELVDVVVTVDTSAAHLAGAMGKAVWILLPFNPDWRWLLDREDSIWYPTARLFRQPAAGDWASVTGRVREALARKLATPG